MKMCTACGQEGYPDTATICERCLSSSLRVYRQRQLNFSHADLAALVSASTPTGGLMTAMVIVILLASSVFLFLAPPSPSPALASRPGTVMPTPTFSQATAAVVSPTATPTPVLVPSPTPAPTPTLSPPPTPEPTPTWTPTLLPTVTVPPPTTRILTATEDASSTRSATGQGTLPAMHAQGTLSLYYDGYASSHPISFPAGTAFRNELNPNITMILASPVTVSEGSPPQQIQASVYEAGSVGNLPSDGFAAYYPVSGSCSGEFPSCVYITSATAFTGGEDAQAYTYIAQGDVDYVLGNARDNARDMAEAQVNQRMRPNEHPVSEYSCQVTTIYQDHQVNDVAPSITATARAVCSQTVST